MLSFYKSKSYKKTFTLKGSRDAVHAISFSAEGRFLAAAGRGGATVWDLATSSAVNIPPSLTQGNQWSPARAFNVVQWMYFKAQGTHVLLLGSMQGYVLILSWIPELKEFKIIARLAPAREGAQIVSMDVYQMEVTHGRGYFVTATEDGKIVLRTLSLSGCEPIFATAVNYDLGAIRFCKGTRDVYIFAAAGGDIACLDRETGKIRFSGRYGPSTMGSICMDDSGKHFVAWTGKDFEMYRLDGIAYKQTFEGDPPRASFPKGAAFTDEGMTLVGGTDRGVAMIYNVKSGAAVQTLQYPEGGLVQPIAAYTSDDAFIIAIAGSTLDCPADVLIFEKPRVSASRKSSKISPQASPKVFGRYIWWAGYLIVFILTLGGCFLIASVFHPPIGSLFGYKILITSDRF